MKAKIIMPLLVAFSVSICSGCASEPSESNIPVAESKDVIVPKDPNTYDDVNSIFAAAFPDLEIRTSSMANWLETHVTCGGYTADEMPDGWSDTMQLLCDATVSACNEIFEKDYGTQNICSQLLTESGDILVTVYNGQVKYNAFDEKETDSPKKKSKGTITQHEFDMITPGMTYSQVVEIVGGEGDLYTEIGSAGSFIGSYKNYVWYGEGMFPGRAILSFDDYVLYSKIAYGLS